MAKNSLFWGKARGKLGEIVLYRAGGEQRSRTYVKNIKNPKSLAQMTQRVKLGSLVSFFRTTSNVLRYSFPNRPQRQSGFNAFVAESLPIATTALPREYADQGLSVPLNYHISKGSVVLPASTFTLGGAASEPDSVGVYLNQPATLGNVVSVSTASLDDVGRYLSEWLGANPEFASTLPMKFNICIVLSEEVGVGCLQTVRVLNVDRSSNTPIVTGNILPTQTGTNVVATIAFDQGGTLLFGPAKFSDANLLFCGVFISYTDVNGKLAVSSAQMLKVKDEDSRAMEYEEFGDIYNQAIQELGVGTNSVLSTN